VTTDLAKVSVEDFEKLKAKFLFDIETFTILEEIPESLVFNWNQMALSISLYQTGLWIKKAQRR